MSTYGEMVEILLELDGRNVYIAGREEDAAPKVLPSFPFFPFQLHRVLSMNGRYTFTDVWGAGRRHG